MKNWITQVIGVCAALFIFSSCEKDEEQAVAQPGDASKITASTSAVTLIQDNAENNAVTFKWSPASYGYSAAQTYTLQFDKQGNKFARPFDVLVGSSTEKTLKVREINSAMLALGLTPGTASTVEVRVKSSISEGVTPLYSSPINLTGVPYRSFIVYPALYVPGNYQGWAPDKAPILASPSNNKNYEGYINFSKTGGYKFTPAPNWDNDYGSDGSANGLKPKGSDLMMNETGYYRIKVDLNAMTYSLLKTSWGIIGSSTANGWGSDTPMTFDAVKGVWSITTNLTAGEIKFRTNSWDADKNFGDNEPDGMPDYDGKNIKIASAGSYTITLDLSQGNGNYSYSIIKN